MSVRPTDQEVGALTYFLNGTRGFNSPPIILPRHDETPIRALPRVPPFAYWTTAEKLVVVLLDLAMEYVASKMEPDKEE